MKAFLEFIDRMQEYPIISIGGTFTWSNIDGIISKIDHIFGNVEWKDKFFDCSTSFIPSGLSDQFVIILNTSETPIQRKTPFKVFNNLLDHSAFIYCLVYNWSISTNFKGVGGIWFKLKNV